MEVFFKKIAQSKDIFNSIRSKCLEKYLVDKGLDYA